MSNGLHPDQVYLGPNCLQRLSTDHKSRGWQANSYCRTDGKVKHTTAYLIHLENP